MVDIHTHILPQIDDGSKSIEESLQMLEMMAISGVDKIVATPHYYHDITIEEFLQKRQKSYEMIKSADVDIPEIFLGTEVRLEFGMHENPDLKKLCIQGTDYILIELPFGRWDEWIFDELFKVEARHNVRIIIAHIERYINMVHMDLIKRLFNMRLYMQVTVDYIGGRFKKTCADKALKDFPVDFIASDCHDTAYRRPCLAEGVTKLNKKYGEDFTKQFMDNAYRMLKNEQI